MNKYLIAWFQDGQCVDETWYGEEAYEDVSAYCKAYNQGHRPGGMYVELYENDQGCLKQLDGYPQNREAKGYE